MPSHLALVSRQPSTRAIARDAIEVYRERHPVLQQLDLADRMNRLIEDCGGPLAALDLLKDVVTVRGEAL